MQFRSGVRVTSGTKKGQPRTLTIMTEQRLHRVHHGIDRHVRTEKGQSDETEVPTSTPISPALLGRKPHCGRNLGCLWIWLGGILTLVVLASPRSHPAPLGNTMPRSDRVTRHFRNQFRGERPIWRIRDQAITSSRWLSPSIDPEMVHRRTRGHRRWDGCARSTSGGRGAMEGRTTIRSARATRSGTAAGSVCTQGCAAEAARRSCMIRRREAVFGVGRNTIPSYEIITPPPR